METAAAMEAAILKMSNGDFSGARKLAVAAQRGGMEGFDQMIAVCDVHCADKEDWYKILGVAADSDAAAVKRQYGKLAVTVHPDKTGLPGAREAFELISRAKAVIGDYEKRMAYDSMVRAKAIADRDRRTFGFSQFRSNQNYYGFSRFQDCEDFGVSNSRVLNYQNVELSGKGVFDSRLTNRVNEVINRVNEVSPLQGQGQGQSQGQGRGRGRGQARVTKEINDVTSNVVDEGSGVVGVKRGRGRPRGSGSKAASASDDAATKTPQGSGLMAASPDANAATKRPQGSGSMATSGDAVAKRPRGRPPSSGRGRGRGRGRGQCTIVEVSSEDEDDHKSKESHPHPASEADKGKESHPHPASEADKSKESHPHIESEAEADKSKESHRGIRPDSKMLEYTDAEFHDFEGERSRECFKKGQVWAVYDTLDAMPRFYAKINAILDDGLKLEITWLEPLPEDEEEKRWLYKGLPASTGRFKQGYSEVVQDYRVFSHLAKWKRDAILKKVYAIRPLKGETWAVFKKWNGLRSMMGMTFGEELEYRVVEIMSDYDWERGVIVRVLVRVEGHGCVFQREEGKKLIIKAKDRLGLSHRIPSVSVSVRGMSFFELDPGSLPIMP
ncbi:uncharacterized protein LOC125206832 [Salvia hispanica]|uniref:uncharacterized protein LOC125206832 n=1 Tax=Salvia hispanica TaxID=49212 RepID=UPI00200994B8|nr:uncharacterized protein LOC125206832 [Salvia hispanica]